MKFMKFGIAVLVVVVVIAILLLQKQETESEVCFDATCFSVEVADTPLEREKGLMERENLDRNAGMLFIFESEGHYPFWMKNTLIPLDMIWIDEDKEIVFIYENALPCDEDPCTVISPSGNAKYVFEINGGLTSKKGIVVGQKLEFIKN